MVAQPVLDRVGTCRLRTCECIGWCLLRGEIGSCCRPLARPLILRQAQDEVCFVGGCHEKLILMLSLSKHDGS
jgi:hypothetical protein